MTTNQQHTEMFALLTTIAVFCRDKEYAERAAEIVKQIRQQDLEHSL